MNIFEPQYSDMKENVQEMFRIFMQVYKTVHNDQTLMKTQDWGTIENEEFYQQNYVILHIYYDSLSTTRIEQFLTDSVTSLICDLGENIGLWLGGSLLTLVEIIDLFINIMNNLRVHQEKTPHKAPFQIRNGFKD